MINQVEILAKAYNAGVIEEYQRLNSSSGRIEFQQVCQIISKYLDSYSTIVDIGSGPGRYAEYFLNQDHFVGCVDIAEKPLDLLKQRLEPDQKANLLFNEKACASQLDWVPDQIADVILLMGPMYHLTSKSNRKKVFRHCSRILKSHGHMFVMYLNHDTTTVLNNSKSEHINSLNKRITNTLFQGFSVCQYRLSPDEAQYEASMYFHPVNTHAIAENAPISSALPPQNAAQFLIHYQQNNQNN